MSYKGKWELFAKNSQLSIVSVELILGRSNSIIKEEISYDRANEHRA